MPKSANQKGKILTLRRLLLERSDEEHPIPMGELVAALERQGISAERKSIYDDMDTLRQSGLDVQSRKGAHPGWFVGERRFQLAELKLLVDAVQSCKFITRRKSGALIHKLEGLTSVHQARQLQRQVYVAGRVKTMNESIYYNIDKLHAAISDNRAVSFRYFDYNVYKEKVFRKEGRRYVVSPWGLLWDNENYYLVGCDHGKGAVRHYRVDKMASLSVTAFPRLEDGRDMDMTGYARKHFGMFSGREGEITLRCRRQLVGVVLDRFGQEIILAPDGQAHFTVTVPVVVSPQFLGWLFGLGDGVEIRAPQWAREAMEAQLAAVARCYRCAFPQEEGEMWKTSAVPGYAPGGGTMPPPEG